MFLGDLFGLVLAEVSFDADDELDTFPHRHFALADVTTNLYSLADASAN
jgi:hypothetical protein